MKINTETGTEDQQVAVPSLELTRVNYFVTCTGAPGTGTREAPTLVEIAIVADQSFDDGSKRRSCGRIVVCSNNYTFPVKSDSRHRDYVHDLLDEVENFLTAPEKVNMPFLKVEGEDIGEWGRKNGLFGDPEGGTSVAPVVYSTPHNVPDAVFRHVWQDLGVLELDKANNSISQHGRIVLVGWCPDRIFNQLRNEVGRPMKPNVFTTLPILDFHEDPREPSPSPSLTVDVRSLVPSDRSISLSVSSLFPGDAIASIVPAACDMPPNGISIALTIADLPIDL